MTVRELLSSLPDPTTLRAHCRAVALLDAVLDPRDPLHTFVPDWREGADLARMVNGSGDEYAVVFDPAGVFLYGFDHESDATPWREDDRVHWPGLLDGLPAALSAYPSAPLFQCEDFFDATVCLWRETGDGEWRSGPVEFEDGETDGSDWLFDLLVDRSPDAYLRHAADYYELSVDRDAVAAVLAGTPLTRRSVAALSASADFATVADRARRIGFRIDES
ncbi:MULTISPECIES: hypothetical protein [Kitasatospora]|uniref:Uncharacterized protein n=2 Tax=Kitasatospora TaxID=2063 RepID=A0ABT1J2F3_9ACTN|nr:hypothetical protein [Kitasatospora paracochleata]MCP2311612.1 hypothetical protein [Kitasatospora paracochleata]